MYRISIKWGIAWRDILLDIANIAQRRLIKESFYRRCGDDQLLQVMTKGKKDTIEDSNGSMETCVVYECI